MDADASRQRDARATRLRLLLAARRRFGVLGYDRTTTRDVAADAGVNVSLISRYFGSKEGLYSAVLAESAALVAEADPSSSGTPTQGRAEFVDQVLAGLRPDAWPEYGHEHPLLLVLRDGGTDPALDRLRRDSMLTSLGSVERMLGGEDGAATPRAELAMATIVGLTVLRSLLGDDLASAADEEALRAELDRLIAGLSDPAGDPTGDPTGELADEPGPGPTG